MKVLLRIFLGFALVIAVVLTTHRWFVGSYRIHTDAMQEALQRGDYVLVNKLRSKNNPGRNRVVLFKSPLLKDADRPPLLLSRCVGVPGDTITVMDEGYVINGQLLPRSPRSLFSFRIPTRNLKVFIETLEALDIPVREISKERGDVSYHLTPFEVFQIREELPASIRPTLVQEPVPSYQLIVPQRGEEYKLDSLSLVACKEILIKEIGNKASISNGKLYIDNREVDSYHFKQNYYWLLSDNMNESVDSRHVGFVPSSYILGNVWLCWWSPERDTFFKRVN